MQSLQQRATSAGQQEVVNLAYQESLSNMQNSLDETVREKVNMAENAMQDKFNKAISEMQHHYSTVTDRATHGWKTELTEARDGFLKSEKECAALQQQRQVEHLEFQQARQHDLRQDNTKEMMIRREACEMQATMQRSNLEQESALHKTAVENKILRSNLTTIENKLGATLASHNDLQSKLGATLANQ